MQLVPGPPIWPQLLAVNKAGTRLFITLNFAGQAGPAHPHALIVLPGKGD